MAVTDQRAAAAALPLEPSDEERMLRESVRGIAQSFGPSYYQRIVREGEPATELWNALGEQGFLGVHLPEEYGGGGLGVYELALVVEEASMAGVPLLTALYSPGVIGTILNAHASEEQKREFLPGIASGEKILSFAITEPDAGTNSHNISTVARKDGDRYVINGQKYYITGMESADYVMVVARTGKDETTGRGELSLFMLDADTPGISRDKIPTVMNMPEGSWQVFFDDVEVPAHRMIGPEGKGLAVGFAGLNAERILTSSICTGIGRYALAKGVAYAKERSVWGKPIGTHQSIAHPLAEAKIHLEAATLMTHRASRLYDHGADAGEASNMAKLLGADAGLHALDRAIQTHGGNGVALEYQLANYFFIVRMLKIGPVSREMILNFVAERSLGLPRSY
jgi:alkylation response protein AidB-like acyl-CoA dehydrogenase